MTDETPLTQEELDEMLMEELGLPTAEELNTELRGLFTSYQAITIASYMHITYVNAFKKLAQKLDQST